MTYAITNPATAEVLETFEPATDAEVAEAIGAAHAAYGEWRRTPLEERIAAVRRTAELYESRRRELAEIITREMGKPVREAEGEISISAAIYRYYADNAAALLADRPLDVASGGRAVVRTAPVGALLGIMPWNYPFYQVARFAAPNLLLGNTILLKHAPSTPGSARAIAELFAEAGLPAGAYANLFASNEQVSTIIADPRVQGVSLTGSERAGRVVGEQAGRHLKKCVLELGGSDPLIVLSTDDLDRAVKIAFIQRMGNVGQACNAAKRIIVVDELYDAFVERYAERVRKAAMGDPMDERTAVGPLASEAAVGDLVALVDDAVGKGAEVLVEGGAEDRPGAWMSPVVLAGITPEMRLYREEAFGPVSSIYRVAGEDEAVRLANDTPFGLGSVVISSDPEQAERVADRLEAGMVYINTNGASEPDLPFGGVKNSGIGRELGPLGILEFANLKLLRWKDR
ncbi:NAD-dependent succinate-semialdehyde dehydrogenase [Gulosibacter sp. 10]|uniref:NAD-dependent succinate-semialdehyde dehydrogenase n=1 Tax=Gulosibacter sp. 10 TaxID=1255570 RepID=UPI00097E85B5|nr:NAD-dependent succinate-semialdehyde dehydrogenase [Gulosibacter sp. 10]SJM67284.1 Succinate-semialdehyde dehydrogenase [NAD]; Succinate-semialdehyde dehydrogenase [NAD(P)+] [Gulosibacter sp. 10]